ncbi:MAG: hypothetical protein HYZ28_20420 [Myxococcales bacterium]|nr:hypothetical protein [Myxococcales bacterium]
MRLSMLACLLASLPAAAADHKGCKDSPLFPRPAGATLESCRGARFDEVALPAAEGQKAEPVRGQVQRLRYAHPARRSPKEVARAHKEALSRAGYSVSFSSEEGGGFVATAKKEGAETAWVSVELEEYNAGERLLSEVVAVKVAPFGALSAKAGSDKRDKKGCADPAGLSRLAGAFLDDCEGRGHDELELQVGPSEKKRLEGEVAQVRYRHDEQASPLEVSQSYRKLLEEAGFGVLHEGTDGAERVLTASRSREGKTEWLSVASATVNADEWTYTYLTLLTAYAP